MLARRRSTLVSTALSEARFSVLGMRRTMLSEIDLGSVEDKVGLGAYAAGFRAMMRGAVSRVVWDSAERALCGMVVSKSGEFMETVAFLSDLAPLKFVRSYCSCPAGYNCEHAAALTLSVAQSCGQDLSARPPSVGWEQSLVSLLEPAGEIGIEGRAQGTGIAIELSLAEDSSTRGQASSAGERAMKLRARLVQRGKTGKWVGGQVAWGNLDSLRRVSGIARSSLQVLRELYWTYQSGNGRPGNRYQSWTYAGGDDRYISLTSFESRQLWPLLDEADALGLPIVYARKQGTVPKYGNADLLLDVVEAESAGSAVPPLAIRPQIRVDDADVVPIRFIGSQGHGVVYAPAGSDVRADPATWRFRLAKFGALVPPQIQQVLMSGRELTVPAEERDKFVKQFYPRLRRIAPVISSDESFTLPAISAPTLVLGAAYGDDHEVDVSWEWSYQVGDSQLRVPLGADGGDTRDLEAERAILAGLDVPADRLQLAAGESMAAADTAQELIPRARLTGIDTMLFSTELLPLLAVQPGVDVEVSGHPANYREAGDSVEVGISTGEIARDNDWFDLGISITVEGRRVPFVDVFTALSRGQSHLLLDDGAYFSLQKPIFQALAKLIEEARALQDLPPGSLRISKFQAGWWAELAELGVVESQASSWQRQADGLLSAGNLDAIDPPDTLTAVLRPYQLDGYHWLAFLWRYQLGGILADDMGLGKTLQSLALISHARQSDPAAPPFLIVAPTSVASNWAAETAKFTPGLKVAVITDTTAKRRSELSDIVAGADAVVTTYAILRLDFTAYSRLTWSGLILDEAQSAKNHQSKVYQCARRLPAPFKLAITGTPMENNLMELWSLLSITAPGLFPSPERFQEYYARPIEKQGKTELLDQLQRRIKPLVKRRTKEQVAAELPAKQEQVLEVELHPRHRKLYQTHLQRERQKVLGLIGDMNSNRFTIFRSLTLLRQLSLHAGLVDPDYEDLPCAKIEALLYLLGDVIGGGHRALVFSQFTRFLERVRARLDEEGIAYCYLDGSTQNRPTVIQRFKNGAAPVFLISLKAGGFGLNLTEADYCFLLDPWWNPAIEAQAVDRTHRIGQSRNVVVYRLISAGTIEDKVMALKERKAELFNSVIDSGNVFGGGLNADDVRGLFS